MIVPTPLRRVSMPASLIARLTTAAAARPRFSCPASRCQPVPGHAPASSRKAMKDVPVRTAMSFRW